jgi:phosphate uptake regulator
MAEQRKLIKLGNSSFAIALPKQWVDQSGLKKGDRVFISHNGHGELTVGPQFKEVKEKKIEINLDGQDASSVKKRLHALYTKGYNLLIFKGKQADRKSIKNLLEEYMGLEIIEANDRETIVKDFFDMKEVKFENFVRRIDNNVKEMFDIVIEYCKKDKIPSSMLREIDDIDKSINKYYFLCSRIFNRGIDDPTLQHMMKMNADKLFNNWWLSFNLESLGDGLKKVLKETPKLSKTERESIYSLLVKLRQIYTACMNSFYNYDLEKAFEVMQETKKTRQILEKFEQNHPQNLKILHHLERVERNIYQNAKMIFYMETQNDKL